MSMTESNPASSAQSAADNKITASVTDTADQMVEIQLHQVMKRSQINDDDIRNMTVKCSACGKQLDHHSKRKIQKHIHLNVIVCKECKDFYGSGEFSQDEDGDKYCRWCGNGGKLYGCDFCSNSFCTECIRRNFGRGEIIEIRDTMWTCYSCDYSKLEGKVAFCDMMLEYSKTWKDKVKKEQRIQKDSVEHNSDFRNMLDASLYNAEALSLKYQKKINKLRLIKEQKCKSLSQVYRKLVAITATHRSEMKKIVDTVSDKYTCQFRKKPTICEKETSTNATLNTENKVPALEIITLDSPGSTDNSQLSSGISIVKEKTDTTDAVKNLSNGVKQDVFVNNVIKEDDSPTELMDKKLHEEHSSVKSSENFDCKNSQETEVQSTFPSLSVSANDLLPNTDKNEDDIVPETNENELAKNSLLEVLFSDSSDSEISFSNFIPQEQEVTEKKCDASNTPEEAEVIIASNNSTKFAHSGNVSENEKEIETTITDTDSAQVDNIDNENNTLPISIANAPEKENGDKIAVVKTDSSNIDTGNKTQPILNVNESDKEKGDKIKNTIIKAKSVNLGNVSTENDEDNILSDFQTKTDTNLANHKPNTFPKKKINDKAILLDSGSSSALSLDTTSDSEGGNKIKIKRTKRKSLKTKCNSNEIVMNNEELDDPKLKLKPCVIVEKLNLELDSDTYKVSGEVSTKSLSIDDDTKELERKIASLSQLPKRRTHSESTDNEKKEKKSAKSTSKVQKQEEIDNDDSSLITLSSNEDEETNEKETHKLTTSKVTDANSVAKLELLESNVSSDSSSDSEIEISKRKKKVTVKKDETNVESKGSSTNSSSDDFQPKKKSKYEKLLREPTNLSDADNDKESKKRKLGKKKQVKRKIMSSDDSSKKSSNSSSMETSSSDSSEKEKKKKNSKSKSKKRKRIKQMSGSSSDDKNSDVEIIGSPAGKGRKNIRKVISKENLGNETKEAQQDEKERRKRVQDRQNLYNKITDTSKDGNEIITRKMVLEVNPDSKEEVVEIHPDLVEKLKPHQINGVKFMWECTIESLKQLETKPGSGCILAHCMGLGKTLQVIAYLYTCLTNKYVSKKIKTAMVICPYNTVLNWAHEFEYWLKDSTDSILLHEMAHAKDNYMRLDILRYWQNEGGVLIISYDVFRRLIEGKMTKFPKKSKQKVFDFTANPGPDIVICDEGHILKNEKSAISKATMKLKTLRRVVLTGTPLQNNLKEYHCMLQFVKPYLLGTAKEFTNRFLHPIMNGQYDDSSQRDVKLMKKRVHILHKLLEGCVQRCDYSALMKFLPPKHEFVISVKLSEVQIKMYRHYLDNLSQSKASGKYEGRTLFADYTSLKNIWTHPYMCDMSFVRAENRRILNDDGSDEMADFIVDSDSSSSSKSGNDSDPKPGTSKQKSSSEDEVIKTYKTRSRCEKMSDESNIDQPDNLYEREKQWYHEFISDDDKYKLEVSGKMVLLMDILKECEAIGDKLIVFSQSLLSLDLIEDILEHLNVQPVTEEDKTRDVTFSWKKGLDYFRMDGTTNADLRKRWIEHFNSPKNDRARLFLISTRAGSLGTNLVGANRVVLLDASWNPSQDVQAIFRVYRFGQVKPVYIYRLLAQGTMEEKIYDRQVTKLSLSIRVVDEQQIDRHFSAAKLAELYTFDPESTSIRPTPMVPNDRLLAEMLIRNKDWIVTYHEHDSLLQNETEEDLTEEERQAAWTEYENEKEGLMNAINNDFVDANIDIAGLNTEPDLAKNYSGNLLPDVTDAIKQVMTKLNAMYPNIDQKQMREKILESLLQLRGVYQTKHVKTLRLKQEYVATENTIPIAMNKYLEELGKALNTLALYINELNVNIYNEKKAQEEAFKARMQQNFRQQQAAYNNAKFAQQRAANQAYINARQFQQMHNSGQAPYYNIRNTNPSYRYVNIQTGKSYPSGQIPKGHNIHSTAFINTPSSTRTGPIITEVEEIIVPDSTTQNGENKNSEKSSVVITEIE